MQCGSNFLVVNTDLDATLLDHNTYSWRPATDALRVLKDRKIPLILNSSKTLPEMQDLSTELGLHDPLVCENGSFIAIPREGSFSAEEITSQFNSVEKIEGYWLCHLGVSRSQFLETITLLRSKHAAYDFRGYADWSVEEVAGHTSLPLEKAALSHQRNGTEPIHWHGTDAAFVAFKKELQEHNLKAVSGGRFIHLSGQSNKGQALLKLGELYEKKYGKVVSIALGDSPNDISMLDAADIAVVIPNKEKLSPTAKRVIHAKEHGPTGWNTTMLEILGV